jgi:HK97 family phage portal protein
MATTIRMVERRTALVDRYDRPVRVEEKFDAPVHKVEPPYIPIQSVFRSIFADPKALKRPYAEIPVVNRCIMECAENASSVPFRVVEGDPEEPTAVEGDPFNDVLQHPNESQNGQEFACACFTLLETVGAAFILMPGREVGGLPTYMKAISPSTADPVYDAAHTLKAWRFSGHDGKPILYETHQVMVIKYADPDRPDGWISRLDVLRRAMAMTWSADAWNLAFFEHGADPGGIFMAKSNMPGDIIEEFKQDLRDHNQGATNRGNPLVLSGGLEYVPFPSSHREMEFFQGLERSDLLTHAVFGVPPEITGFKTGTYENQQQARRAFWKFSLLPRMRKFEAAFRELMRFATAGRRWVAFDLSKVAELQEDLLEKLEKADRLQKLGYSMNEVNERLKLGMKNRPEGDRRLVPAGLQPLDEIGMGPEYNPETAARAVGFTARPPRLAGSEGPRLLAPASPSASSPVGSAPPGQAGEAAPMGNVERAADDVVIDVLDGRVYKALPPGCIAKGMTRYHATQFAKAVAKLEKAFESKVRRHFMDLRAMTLQAVGAAFGKDAGDVICKELGVANLLNLWGGGWASHSAKLVRIVSPLYEAAARTGIDTLADEIGMDLIDVPESVKTALMSRRQEIVGVDDTMRRRLHEAIAEGIGTGNLADLQESVRDVFNVGAKRAQDIARTEMFGAVDEARFLTMREANVPFHEWLTAGDEVVRDTHKDCDGEVRRVGEPFPNGLLYPHDASAPAGEVINCRCRAVAVYHQD